MYDLLRNQWLNPTNYPITGPVWSGAYLQYFNIHWTGSSGSVANSAEKNVLNGIQKDYVENRGYSIGYSAAVGLSGTIYEVRGTTYRAASNGDSTTFDDDLPNNPQLLDNLEVFSVLLIMGIPDKISQAMLDSVRRLYDNMLHSFKPLVINGHDDLDSTGCPGPQAQDYINRKLFYPVDIPIEEDDMKVLPTPKRVIDTRTMDYEINGIMNKAGNPVGPGKFQFNLGTSPSITQVEATVTAVAQEATGGFVGVNDKDSFINWISAQMGVPIPQTITLPVNQGKTDLYFTSKVHLLVSIRAEG